MWPDSQAPRGGGFGLVWGPSTSPDVDLAHEVVGMAVRMVLDYHERQGFFPPSATLSKNRYAATIKHLLRVLGSGGLLPEFWTEDDNSRVLDDFNPNGSFPRIPETGSGLATSIARKLASKVCGLLLVRPEDGEPHQSYILATPATKVPATGRPPTHDPNVFELDLDGYGSDSDISDPDIASNYDLDQFDIGQGSDWEEEDWLSGSNKDVHGPNQQASLCAKRAFDTIMVAVEKYRHEGRKNLRKKNFKKATLAFKAAIAAVEKTFELERCGDLHLKVEDICYRDSLYTSCLNERPPCDEDQESCSFTDMSLATVSPTGSSLNLQFSPTATESVATQISLSFDLPDAAGLAALGTRHAQRCAGVGAYEQSIDVLSSVQGVLLDM